MTEKLGHSMGRMIGRVRTRLMLPIGLAALLAVTVVACAIPLDYPRGPETGPPALTQNHFVAPDGVELPLRVWAPPETNGAGAEHAEAPRAVLIALHGFNDYSRFFEDTGPFLAEVGILTYAYDQRGFGESPNRGLWAGTETYRKDLVSMIEAVKAKHPGAPVYVLGDSFGGAVTAITLSEPENGGPRPDVDGAILVAPAVWGRETMPWYQNLSLFIAAHTVPWLTLSGEGLDVKPSDNIETLIKLGRDPLVLKETRVEAIHGLVNAMDAALASAPRLKLPTLLLYGGRDDVVPKGPVLTFAKRLSAAGNPDFTFALYPEAHHLLLRDLDAERSWRDIAAWIDNPSGPLPSNAGLSRIPEEISARITEQ